MIYRFCCVLLFTALLAGCQDEKVGGPCSYLKYDGFSEVVAIDGVEYQLRFELPEEPGSDHREKGLIPADQLSGRIFHEGVNSPGLSGAKTGDRFHTQVSVITEGTCTPVMFELGGAVKSPKTTTSAATIAPAADVEVAALGKVLSVEDTGLGPFDGLTIEESVSGEKIYFRVQQGSFASAIAGKYVHFKYKAIPKINITGLMLESEYQDTHHVYLSGTYKFGQIGDMGSYITIVDAKGVESTYQGDFDLDADNAAKYAGKQVVLFYDETVEYELLSLDAIKGDTNAIKGKVTDVRAGQETGTFLLSVENDNEIVDVLTTQNMLGKSGTMAALKGQMVALEYASEAQKVLISYSFESAALNEYATSEEAIAEYEHLNKMTEVGRFVNSRIERGSVYLEIETAEGPIFENVLVYPSLGLSDNSKYRDEEFTFTFVDVYKNSAVKLIVQEHAGE